MPTLKQVIVGKSYDTPSANAFCPLNPGYNSVQDSWATTSTDRRISPIPTAGTIKNFRFKVGTAPGSGKSDNFTLYSWDGTTSTATSVVVTISDLNTTGSDLTHTISVTSGMVSAGIAYQWKYTKTGTPAATGAIAWSFEFVSDNGDAIIFGCSSLDPATGGSTEYNYLMGGAGQDWDATAANRKQIMPMNGTMRNLVVFCDAAAGTGNSWNISVGAMTATTDNTTLIAFDNTNTQSVSAGDVVQISSVGVSNPSFGRFAWAVAITPSVAGEFPIMGGTTDLLSTVTEYQPFCSSEGAWISASSSTSGIVNNFTAKKFYVGLSAAPGTAGSGKSYTLGVAKSTTIQISLTISDTSTTGNNTTDKYAFIDDDLTNIRVNSANTPTAVFSYWGFVGTQPYVFPSVINPILSLVSSVSKVSKIATNNKGVLSVISPVISIVAGGTNVNATVIVGSLSIIPPLVKIDDSVSVSNINGILSVQSVTTTSSTSSTFNASCIVGNLSVISPTVNITKSIDISPLLANVSVINPSIQVTDSVTVSHVTGILSVISPEVVVGTSKSVNVIIGNLIVNAASVSVTDSVDVQPITGNLSVISPNTQISLSKSVNVITGLLSVISPSVFIGLSKSVNALNINSTVNAVSISISTSINVNPVVGLLSVVSPTVNISDTNSTLPVIGNLSVISPSVVIGLSTNISALRITSVVNAVSTQSTSSNSVQPVTGNLSVINSSISVDDSVSIQSINGTLSVQAVTVSISSGVSKSVDAITGNLIVNAVSVQISDSTTSQPITGNLLVVPPTIQSSSATNVNVNAITGILSIPSATLSISSNATFNASPIIASISEESSNKQIEKSASVISRTLSVQSINPKVSLDLSPIQIIATLVSFSSLTATGSRTVNVDANVGILSAPSISFTPVDPLSLKRRRFMTQNNQNKIVSNSNNIDNKYATKGGLM